MFLVLTRLTTSVVILIMYPRFLISIKSPLIGLLTPQIMAKHRKHFMEVSKRGEELSIRFY